MIAVIQQCALHGLRQDQCLCTVTRYELFLSQKRFKFDHVILKDDFSWTENVCQKDLQHGQLSLIERILISTNLMLCFLVDFHMKEEIKTIVCVVPV